MILPIDCLDIFSALLPDTSGWLVAAAEPSLHIDESLAADWADISHEKHSGPFASLRFAAAALLLAMAAWVWRRWRSLKWLSDRRTVFEEDALPSEPVTALRRRHERLRDPDADSRMDALLELHRLYTRGDTAAVYEGLKQHFETHPFELNLYIVCLNMLAETGSKPSPEMLRLLRHAFRQLKVLRPHMWMAVAEQGKRLVPDFEQWDDKPLLPPRSKHRS